MAAAAKTPGSRSPCPRISECSLFTTTAGPNQFGAFQLVISEVPGQGQPAKDQADPNAVFQELFALKGRTGMITSVAFSPDSTRIVSSSGLWDRAVRNGDKTLIVWTRRPARKR